MPAHRLEHGLEDGPLGPLQDGDRAWPHMLRGCWPPPAPALLKLQPLGGLPCGHRPLRGDGCFAWNGRWCSQPGRSEANNQWRHLPHPLRRPLLFQIDGNLWLHGRRGEMLCGSHHGELLFARPAQHRLEHGQRAGVAEAHGGVIVDLAWRDGRADLKVQLHATVTQPFAGLDTGIVLWWFRSRPGRVGWSSTLSPLMSRRVPLLAAWRPEP